MLSKKTQIYNIEYKKLNSAQREAVDTIDGPVMVVAGPGTGKTQILALRIGSILEKTDIKGDGILCLTFTNAAVSAMKARLEKYIGEASAEVNVFTFHSFGMKVIEEHFKVLGLSSAPKLLEDTETVIFFDRILQENEWEYLRPRGDHARYFSDLRSLISLLVRERITEEDFSVALSKEIKFLETNEDSISTRGESKGELKKEIVKKIEGLEHSREIVTFMKLYEKAKKENNVLDYDDVLENLVKIIEKSQDAASDIRERYLYILVDEHQDSSRVQNEFLKKVWGESERPDIFVVGDDRQLIYGFSGASIDHFKGFKKTFHDAKIIPLVENYRSTQVILDASHALLQSVMSNEKLKSHNKGIHPIKLLETAREEEEIVAAGLDIEEKMKTGLNPNDCAILVPKNAQVRSALLILHTMGLPVGSLEALNLFDQEEGAVFLRVLKIINGDVPSLALSFFDKLSGIEPLEAHKFIAGENMREFSFDSLIKERSPILFDSNNIERWISKLSKWLKDSKENNLQSFIEIIGQELFNAKDKKLVSSKEIVDTFLGLLALRIKQNPNLTLAEFVSYLDKLEAYGEHIPLVSEIKEGIKVLTMHSSKGLEFEYVWIAHMDERSLASGKKIAFSLPEFISERIEERDIDAIKRKLYVAITRAKRFCTLSYAVESRKGQEQGIARVIADLPPEVFSKEKARTKPLREIKIANLSILATLSKLVTLKYADRYISATLLNSFFECPWKWYFRNLLQLPEAKLENLEFGSQVHSAIDKILKLDHVPSKKELNDLLLNKEAMKIVSKWVQNRLPEIKLNRRAEESIRVLDQRFPHLKIYGKIDLIENLGPKEVRVTDFKTGSVKKKSDIEKFDEEGRMSSNLRQLAMYSYLLEENPKWKVDVRESRLEFLEAKNQKESFYDRAITSKEIDLLVEDIEDYDYFVTSGKWVERECHYNSYGKATGCEYCKMAQIYTGKTL